MYFFHVEDETIKAQGFNFVRKVQLAYCCTEAASYRPRRPWRQRHEDYLKIKEAHESMIEESYVYNSCFLLPAKVYIISFHPGKDQPTVYEPRLSSTISWCLFCCCCFTSIILFTVVPSTLVSSKIINFFFYVLFKNEKFAKEFKIVFIDCFLKEE